MSTSPAGASSSPPAAALAAEADARLQQLLAQMLARSQAAGDANAALAERIQQQQLANLAPEQSAAYRIYELAGGRGRIARREAATASGRDPVDPQPYSFPEAVTRINAWLTTAALGRDDEGTRPAPVVGPPADPAAPSFFPL